MEKVSIKIGKDTLEELNKLKVHYRETYDDVVRRLIDGWKSTK
jgi:predicted CopG family antitoxin